MLYSIENTLSAWKSNSTEVDMVLDTGKDMSKAIENRRLWMWKSFRIVLQFYLSSIFFLYVHKNKTNTIIKTSLYKLRPFQNMQNKSSKL